MVPPRADPSVLETVSRRRDLLAALESTPLDKPGLVTTLECSRSTVDRAIRELEQFDLLTRTDEGFELTVAGRLALEEYRRCHEALEAIDGVGRFLEHVPRNAPMSVAMLQGATVREPAAYAPTEPHEEIAQFLDGADRFRTLTSSEPLPVFRTLLYDGVVEGTLDAEAVFTDDFVSFLRVNRSPPLREMMERGEFQLYATPSIPYGLAVIDRPAASRAVVVIRTETGDVRAVIENDTEAALSWARAVYSRYRARAVEVSPSAFEEGDA